MKLQHKADKGAHEKIQSGKAQQRDVHGQRSRTASLGRIGSSSASGLC